MFSRLRRTWAYHRIPADIRVFHALVNGETYTLDICRKYRVGVGKIYALLMVAENWGHISSEWEPNGTPHPRRRYYLTPEQRTRIERVSTDPLHRDHWARLDRLRAEEGRP